MSKERGTFQGVKRHVYYGCTKVRDKECKCGYLNEEDLIEQLAKLMDTIDINEIGIREKIKIEVERFKKFQSCLLGVKEKISVQDIDIRAYTKYLLREGTMAEKRELLGCLKSRLVLKEKIVSLVD